VDLMLAIGAWTAGLPGAVRTVASAPNYVLPIAFLGVLFVCLWQGRLRWMGLPFCSRRPDLAACADAEPLDWRWRNKRRLSP
jgi:hypothetical protein